MGINFEKPRDPRKCKLLVVDTDKPLSTMEKYYGEPANLKDLELVLQQLKTQSPEEFQKLISALDIFDEDNYKTKFENAIKALVDIHKLLGRGDHENDIGILSSCIISAIIDLKSPDFDPLDDPSDDQINAEYLLHNFDDLGWDKKDTEDAKNLLEILLKGRSR